MFLWEKLDRGLDNGQDKALHSLVVGKLKNINEALHYCRYRGKTNSHQGNIYPLLKMREPTFRIKHTLPHVFERLGRTLNRQPARIRVHQMELKSVKDN